MSLKLPPEPTDNYILWRKDVAIWKKLTDTPRDKMGAALQYACRHNQKLHEAVLEIPEADVDGEGGIDKVLGVLDCLHNVDKQQTAIQCYEKFLSLTRKEDQKVLDFIQEFDTLANKTKVNGNVFSDDLLAYRLMKALNLPESDQRIIKATAEEFTVAGIKKVLKKSYKNL